MLRESRKTAEFSALSRSSKLSEKFKPNLDTSFSLDSDNVLIIDHHTGQHVFGLGHIYVVNVVPDEEPMSSAPMVVEAVGQSHVARPAPADLLVSAVSVSYSDFLLLSVVLPHGRGDAAPCWRTQDMNPGVCAQPLKRLLLDVQNGLVSSLYLKHTNEALP